jgi:exopolysaccharide production protein ExoZ
MKLHSLQAARAIAAWLVIVDHVLLELTGNDVTNPTTHLAWFLGGAGVYLFFVISGFIMVHISWDSFGRESAPSKFLWRRMVRIVPLYWLATFAAFAYHRVSETHGGHAGPLELGYSLTFIPHLDEDGSWSPILPQGWTLSYEMMFYGLFGLALCLPRRAALLAVAAVLGGLVLAGPLQSSAAVSYLASPIVLWFVLGIGLAVAWRQFGLREPARLARAARFLEPLGDASYSTYLVHGVVLTLILRVWLKAVGSPSFWLVPASLVLATLAGWLVHIAVERPLLAWGSDLTRPRERIAASLPGAGKS